MLGESNLLPLLERMVKPNGDPYVVYGDPAYGITRHIISPPLGSIVLKITRDELPMEYPMEDPLLCDFKNYYVRRRV